MTNDPESSKAKTDRQLWQVVRAAVALSIGLMCGFLWSVKAINPHLQFKFSVGTVVAFFAGAVFTWFVWHGIARAGRQRKPALVLLSVVLIGGTVGAFVYGLKGLAWDRLSDYAIGTAWAVGFLAVAGWLLWRTGRYFTNESRDADEEHREDK